MSNPTMRLASPKQKMYALSEQLLIDLEVDGKLRFEYDPVFTPIFGPTLDYATLFAYLFRRFGYPNVGCDNYKDHSQYLLTTSRDDLIICVRPYVGPATHLHFSLFVSKDVYSAVCALPRRRQMPTEWSDLDEPWRSLYAAADAAGRELLVPVIVRDQSINVLGLVTEGDDGNAVAQAHVAGYPSGALGNIDPELMAEIHHLAHVLGNGDLRAGMKALIALVPDELRTSKDEHEHP